MRSWALRLREWGCWLTAGLLCCAAPVFAGEPEPGPPPPTPPETVPETPTSDKPRMADVGKLWTDAMNRVVKAGLGSGHVACERIDFAGYTFTSVAGELIQGLDPATGDTLMTLKNVTASGLGGKIGGTLEFRFEAATKVMRYSARDVEITGLDLAKVLEPFGAEAILGVVSGKVTISGDSGSQIPRVEGSIELEKASFHGIFLELVSARLLIDPATARIELQQLLGTGYKGDLKGSLKIELARAQQQDPPRLSAKLLFEGFDIAAIAHDMGQGGSRINGNLAGEVTIQADLNTGDSPEEQGHRVKNLRITGRLDAAPLAGPGFTLQDISGNLSVDLDRNKLEINGLRAGAYGGRVQGLASAKWASDSYSYQVALETKDLDLKDLFVDITRSRTVKGGMGEGIIILTGSSAANGGKGGLERVRGLFKTVNFEMGQSLFLQEMRGWLAWDDATQVTQLTQLNCRAYGGEFDGQVKLLKPEVGDLQTQLDGRIRNMDLGSLNAKFGSPTLEVEGQMSGDLALKMNGALMNEMSMDVRLRRANIRQVHINYANLTVDLAPPEVADGASLEAGDQARQLNFRLSDAHAYDGVLRMIGRIDIDSQGRFRTLQKAQLNLAGIQIKDLLDNIGFGGGKRQLEIDGHCDALLEFSQDFDDPGSRLGHGHLQVKNGHIVEFPQAILLISRFSLDKPVFTALDARFQLVGDVLHFDSLDLIDQNSKIKLFMDQKYGQGAVDANGFIGSPFFMKWEYPRTGWTEWPIIGWLYFVREFSNAMIVGSFADPHIQDWPSAGILELLAGETVAKRRKKHSVQYQTYLRQKEKMFQHLAEQLFPPEEFWKNLH